MNINPLVSYTVGRRHLDITRLFVWTVRVEYADLAAAYLLDSYGPFWRWVSDPAPSSVWMLCANYRTKPWGRVLLLCRRAGFPRSVTVTPDRADEVYADILRCIGGSSAPGRPSTVGG